MRFCAKCGSENADQSKFCMKCGAPLPPVVPPAGEATGRPQPGAAQMNMPTKEADEDATVMLRNEPQAQPAPAAKEPEEDATVMLRNEPQAQPAPAAKEPEEDATVMLRQESESTEKLGAQKMPLPGAKAVAACPKCGKPLRPNAKFCMGCGFHLEEAEQTSARPVPPAGAAPVNPPQGAVQRPLPPAGGTAPGNVPPVPPRGQAPGMPPRGQAPGMPPTPPVPPMRPETEKKGAGKGLIIAVIIVAIIVAILAVVLIVGYMKGDVSLPFGNSKPVTTEEADSEEESEEDEEESEEDSEEEDSEDKDSKKDKDEKDSEKATEASSEAADTASTEAGGFVSGQENVGDVPVEFQIDAATVSDYANNLEQDDFIQYEGNSVFSFWYPTQIYNHVLVDVTETAGSPYGTNLQLIHFTGTDGSDGFFQLSTRNDTTGVDKKVREIEAAERSNQFAAVDEDRSYLRIDENGEGVIVLYGTATDGKNVAIMIRVNDQFVMKMEVLTPAYAANDVTDQRQKEYVVEMMMRLCRFSDNTNPWEDFDSFQMNYDANYKH